MTAGRAVLLTAVLGGGLIGCAPPQDGAPRTDGAPPPGGAPAASVVDRARIVAADADDWLTHGRTYDEQRFSPLAQIDRDNVSGLGLAWWFDIPTRRGIEATPIVVDGRMYVSGSWSIVYALDAASGELLWKHDPGVPKEWAQYACCDVVNRGVAVWGGRVYVGTLDGWLVAIDAASGEQAWRVDTIDRQPPYTITGAPRVVNGQVIIGNGGADYGVRGYVSAYDADTGALRWRFHTVPGNPEEGQENEALAMAASTWTGEWWQYGGGGTVWDSMAHDPELGLLYIGVGNGSPWNQKIRSPGGGDNLFLSSVVALRADTGEYVWHYQTTPGETWDYTATQHIVLADLDIDGRMRKVLMQAPKNGFFYVLDRTDGTLIGARNYVPVNWATGIDPQSGRPIESLNARFVTGPFLILPSPLGGHNWHPMSFSPETGLVYLPAQEIPFVHADAPNFRFRPGYWNTGVDLQVAAAPDAQEALDALAESVRGQLVAWDPVAQREVWRYQHAGPWNGGVLSTAGGLVFQGSLIGEFAAYDAGNGERLWQFDAQTGVAAAPVTYAVDGAQHVAVAVGWGSVFALIGGPHTAAMKLTNRSRVLSFRLGAEGALPAAQVVDLGPVPRPPVEEPDAAQVALGKSVFFARCHMCHGDGAQAGGVIPDLRYLAPAKRAAWDDIVRRGALRKLGMPGFGGILTNEQSDAVLAYVTERAWVAYRQAQGTQ